MGENLLKNVKKVLKALLISGATQNIGMPVQDLLSDYRGFEGREIPHAELGFTGAFTLLQSIPDTLIITFENGAPCAFPKVSADNKHIFRMVSESKTHNKTTKQRKSNLRFCARPRQQLSGLNNINKHVVVQSIKDQYDLLNHYVHKGNNNENRKENESKTNSNFLDIDNLANYFSRLCLSSSSSHSIIVNDASTENEALRSI